MTAASQNLANRRGDARLAQASRAIEQAVDAVLADPASRTADLGGPLGTRAFAARVAAQARETVLRS